MTVEAPIFIMLRVVSGTAAPTKSFEDHASLGMNQLRGDKI